MPATWISTLLSHPIANVCVDTIEGDAVVTATGAAKVPMALETTEDMEATRQAGRHAPHAAVPQLDRDLAQQYDILRVLGSLSKKGEQSLLDERCIKTTFNGSKL